MARSVWCVGILHALALVAAFILAAEAQATSFANPTDTQWTGQPAPYWARGPYPYHWTRHGAGAWRRDDASPDWNDAGLSWRRTRQGIGGIHAHWAYRSAFSAARVDWTMRPAHDGRDGVQFARAHLAGINWPNPLFDVAVLAGVGYLDEQTRINGAVGGHVMLQASVWPIWPVGVNAWVDVGTYRQGANTLDWSIELRWQWFKSLGLTLGWRESRLMEAGGTLGGFGHRGLTVGVSMSFSSISDAFRGHLPSTGPDPDWP